MDERRGQVVSGRNEVYKRLERYYSAAISSMCGQLTLSCLQIPLPLLPPRAHLCGACSHPIPVYPLSGRCEAGTIRSPRGAESMGRVVSMGLARQYQSVPSPRRCCHDSDCTFIAAAPVALDQTGTRHGLLRMGGLLRKTADPACPCQQFTTMSALCGSYASE